MFRLMRNVHLILGLLFFFYAMLFAASSLVIVYRPWLKSTHTEQEQTVRVAAERAQTPRDLALGLIQNQGLKGDLRDIKQEAGSAAPLENEIEIEIRGRDLGSGLPRAGKLNSADIRKALDDPIQQIIAAVRDTLDRTPPELAGDLMERGMTLAGGGALLQGFADRMSEECQMPARLAESPLTCVATGSGQALEEFEAIKRALKNSRVRRRY